VHELSPSPGWVGLFVLKLRWIEYGQSDKVISLVVVQKMDQRTTLLRTHGWLSPASFQLCVATSMTDRATADTFMCLRWPLLMQFLITSRKLQKLFALLLMPRCLHACSENYYTCHRMKICVFTLSSRNGSSGHFVRSIKCNKGRCVYIIIFHGTYLWSSVHLSLWSCKMLL